MPTKILKTKLKPEFAIGDDVEAAYEGGSTANGKVIDVRYNHKAELWQYRVQMAYSQSPASKEPPKYFYRWLRGYDVYPAQEAFKFPKKELNKDTSQMSAEELYEALKPTDKEAAKPLKKSRWQPGDEGLLPMGGTKIPVIVEYVNMPLDTNNEARVKVMRKGSTPGNGQSWMVWESDIQPVQMDLFANWLEKSRDMYRVEQQKPIGKDRKQVEGPFPRSVPNTWMELPMEKPLSKKTTIIAAGKCQMCGSPLTGSTCSRCKYTPTKKQFYGVRVTAGDVVQGPWNGAPAPVMEPAAPGEDGSDISDALLYQFDMLRGELQNLLSSAQSWAAESTDPQEIVQLKRMGAKLQAMLKIIQQ